MKSISVAQPIPTAVKPLVEAGCNTIIVVHLSPEDLSIDPRHFPGVRILPIVPSQSLGGLSATLDFSNEGAAKRMEQGYADALLLLRHLELFISNEMQYEALWERVRATTEHEHALSAKLQATDHAHQRTIGDIHSFNRQIQQDDFRHDVQLAADDDEVLPQALDQLALENSALLADIERQRIETAVDSFLAQNHNNRNKVEKAVMDALATNRALLGALNELLPLANQLADNRLAALRQQLDRLRNDQRRLTELAQAFDHLKQQMLAIITQIVGSIAEDEDMSHGQEMLHTFRADALKRPVVMGEALGLCVESVKSEIKKVIVTVGDELGSAVLGFSTLRNELELDPAVTGERQPSQCRSARNGRQKHHLSD